MKALRYEPRLADAWNRFVADSRNGTFLFNRAYMEYHADRFTDHSLVVLDDADRIVALLPANLDDDELVSHAGLTYGGFVVGPAMSAGAMLDVFGCAIEHARGQGISRIRYKTVPHIYHTHPAEEDRYALFRHGARLYRRDLLSVATPPRQLPFQERRLRRVKQALKAGVRVERSGDPRQFWDVLEHNLHEAHGARPVHTATEMELLMRRFPGNIGLHLALLAGTVVAGAVVYDARHVAHVQYIGSSEHGRAVGALDLLFSTLIGREYASRAYFDFGISNEDQGRVLNRGLVEHKEGFGARSVVHDFYELDIA